MKLFLSVVAVLLGLSSAHAATGLSSVVFTNLDRAYFDVDFSRPSSNVVRLVNGGGGSGSTNWVDNGTGATIAGVARSTEFIGTNGIAAGNAGVLNDGSILFYGTDFKNSLGVLSTQSEFTNAFTESGTFYLLAQASSNNQTNSIYNLDTQVLTDYGSTNNFSYINGLYSAVQHGGSGNILTATGFEPRVINYSDGNIGDSYGTLSAVANFGTGVITNATGIFFQSLGLIQHDKGIDIKLSTGHTVDAVGINIRDVTGATTNWSIKTGLGKVEFGDTVATTSSYTSGAPSGGTAAAWKLGSYKTNAVTLVATNYVEVEIGGVLRKLAIVQ